MRLQWFLACAALFAPVLAEAGSAPAGIAFAQSEAATAWCRDEEPAKAMDCALAKCGREAVGVTCYPTRWCAPAGWSGLMVAWLPEFHSTVIVCGASGQAAVLAALKGLCDASEELTRCDMVSVVDPNGIEVAKPGESWPGPATAPPGNTEN
jgi:hypothetical protein